MVVASVAFHGAVFSLGSTVLVRPAPFARETVVTMELMEAPPAEPEPQDVVKAAPALPGPAAPNAEPAADPRPPRPSARRWLDRLDDPLAGKRAAGGREGEAPARSARHSPRDPSERPDDISAASRTGARPGGNRLDEIEKRVGARRVPSVLGGEGIGAGLVVNGLAGDRGDPIPAAVRDMIRARVAGYLPELEAAYSSAYRLNPGLKGKLVIRIRIDARGNVARVEPVEAAVPDQVFAAAVIERVRGWVFVPAAGFAVEVIYPFVFVAPA